MMVMPKEDVTQVEVSKQSERLKKSHIFLMKHPKIMACRASSLWVRQRYELIYPLRIPMV
jgi:hypothetical protein